MQPRRSDLFFLPCHSSRNGPRHGTVPTGGFGIRTGGSGSGVAILGSGTISNSQLSISINTFVASFMISQARVASTPQRFVASSGLKVNSGGKVRLNSRIIIFWQNTFVSQLNSFSFRFHRVSTLAPSTTTTTFTRTREEEERLSSREVARGEGD